MFREIRYRTLDGEKLAGILSIPKNPHGFVLMMHGITESKDEYLGFYSKMAKSLHDNGVASLRFDFRGHGESTGSSLDISVIGDVLDIKASIAQVRKYWKRPISLVATSFGRADTNRRLRTTSRLPEPSSHRPSHRLRSNIPKTRDRLG